METLRTPDERFADLPDFPFPPHYVEIDDGDGGTLRVHHLDEGPAGGPVIVLLHGEPSWSFLYRHMVPPLVEAGLRCVVPDLVGFGRSDKPAHRADVTYARMVAWTEALLVDALDVRDATFFGQDWGGLIGLRVVAAHPDRFARVVVGNTGLPDGSGRPSAAFLAWREFAATAEEFPIGRIVAGGTTGGLTDEVIAAYDAPFPDDSFTAAARTLPGLVPVGPDDPAVPDQRAAWAVLERWEKPFVCCFSDADPVTAGGERVFLRRVPGAAGRENVTIAGAGHFFQEEAPDALVRVILDTVAEG